jgi:hypothetical protein
MNNFSQYFRDFWRIPTQISKCYRVREVRTRDIDPDPDNPLTRCSGGLDQHPTKFGAIAHHVVGPLEFNRGAQPRTRIENGESGD